MQWVFNCEKKNTKDDRGHYLTTAAFFFVVARYKLKWRHRDGGFFFLMFYVKLFDLTN